MESGGGGGGGGGGGVGERAMHTLALVLFASPPSLSVSNSTCLLHFPTPPFPRWQPPLGADCRFAAVYSDVPRPPPGTVLSSYYILTSSYLSYMAVGGSSYIHTYIHTCTRHGKSGVGACICYGILGYSHIHILSQLRMCVYVKRALCCAVLR